MFVRPASFPSLGIDCVTILDAVRCATLRQAGISFVVRYLGAISQAERDNILAAGLALSVVTYSRAEGWLPTSGMGTADGETDLAHLAAAGIPVGATVWIDLEGCGGAASAAMEWVNERAAVLAEGGYDVGLYVGSFQPLSAEQLYAIPTVDRYWRSLSSGVPEPACGWSMIQLWPTTTIGGTEVDVDVVQQDHKGRLPLIISA